MEEEIRSACKAYPYLLSLHAFFEDKQTGRISFDAVIDFACEDSLALAAQIEADLSARYPDRQFTVKVDRAYSD